MKRITLSDIAKKCGVSVNTVSHALNGKPDISLKTSKYIKEVANELGYIQNSAASFLRSGLSKSIAIIVGDISNPHFSIMIKEIEDTARKNGYVSLVLNTDENEEIEREAICAAISKNVDGIIICPVQKSDINIKFLMESNLPFTLIGRRFYNLNTSYAVCDDFHSGKLAADYIIKNGKKKTAIISAGLYISSAAERLNGIKAQYEQSGITLDSNDIYYLSVASVNHAVQMKKILSKGYDNVICFNDTFALELLTYTKEKLEIISFDSIRTKFAMPFYFKSITSKTKMSHTAVKILIDKINGKQSEIQKILPTKLV